MFSERAGAKRGGLRGRGVDFKGVGCSPLMEWFLLLELQCLRALWHLIVAEGQDDLRLGTHGMQPAFWIPALIPIAALIIISYW